MQGAYLVSMGTHGQQGDEEFAGRVEEIDSGRSIRFRSGEELLVFLRERQQEIAAEQKRKKDN